MKRLKADLDAEKENMDKIITDKANKAGNAKFKDFKEKWGAWVYILASNCIILLVLLAMLTNAGAQILNVLNSVAEWFCAVPERGGLYGVDDFNYVFWWIMRIVAGILLIVYFTLVGIEMDRITFAVWLLLADMGVFGALYKDNAIVIVIALFTAFIVIRTYLGCKQVPDWYYPTSVWEEKTNTKPFPNASSDSKKVQ